MLNKRALLALMAASLAVCVLLGTAPATQACSAKSLTEAKEASAKRDLPVLMAVGASWSKSCKMFDKTISEKTGESGLAKSLHDKTVLLRLDAEDGEGKELAKTYNIVSYPTFILTDSHGETIDRWTGYKKEAAFLTTLDEALVDPTTISQKLERYRENPTEKDARKLGDLRLYAGYPAEAVAFYRRAQTLNPDADTNYPLRIFGAMARGTWAQLYELDQVKGQADVVMASSGKDPKAVLEVLHTMKKLAKVTGEANAFHPYLEVAVKATAGIEDKGFAGKRQGLLVDYALYIEKDKEKAIELRKAALPENWLENARELNNFAWWCFENHVNLEEAEGLARRGVELAKPGQLKANVLDTLAELCNLNDNCSHAVEYIRLAIQEDPENEYFQNQLVRFEEILAMSHEE